MNIQKSYTVIVLILFFTILSCDPAPKTDPVLPEISITPMEHVVNEGDDAPILLTVNANIEVSQDTMIEFSVTGDSDSYIVSPSNMVTIESGKTEAQITITAIQDDDHDDEEITVALVSNNARYVLSENQVAKITINDSQTIIRNQAQQFIKQDKPTIEDIPLANLYSIAQYSDDTLGDINTATHIILYEQGGPSNELNSHVTNALQSYSSDPSIAILNVHQWNTYESSILVADHLFSPSTTRAELTKIASDYPVINNDQVFQYNLRSAAILSRVIQYFYSQGKTVYVMGHSFGSFIIPLYMSFFDSYTNVHGYAITGGRIEMPQEVVDQFKTGLPGFFDEDGIFTSYSTAELISEFGWPSDTVIPEPMFNSARLQAAAALDYTMFLEDRDLSKVLYIYANNDEAVGQLSTKEINFLEENHATITLIEDGGHRLSVEDVNGDIIRDDAKPILEFFNIVPTKIP